MRAEALHRADLQGHQKFAQPLEVLSRLQDVSVFDVAGQDNTRWRAVSVLIHGNEPSGFYAMCRYWHSAVIPAVNLRFIVASVSAAKTAKWFSQRYIEGERDLNRCFALDDNQADTLRAQRIVKAIREVTPECVVDLHNTSGQGPAFAVALQKDLATRKLAGLWSDYLIHTGLRLGSLMEQEFDCPTLTIECGGSDDAKSHQIAYQGICRLAISETLDECAFPAQVLSHPMRVELRPGMSLSYANQRQHLTDVCILQQVTQYNYDGVEQGDLLGWINGADLSVFRVRDEMGNDLHLDLFTLDNNQVRFNQSLHIFMATTSVKAATEDCLFYCVKK
ncbi:succinylglutamate desuccinylase/aspartoacylase family protein [Bowmanella sp. JS7-9]|uniref:Succinylglutamate desuccinylase/aspartoacylase family protein n=1 Tax=Pseudobowmanella zhangzhouensis TaxID=1537679 RepID=A0ABW1XN53_9ALTE|nr:succinylglutamate desuccinylase/aspartoacylase family protein [Bowmanella sp. JS7-9]